jgi:hypothetical protein
MESSVVRGGEARGSNKGARLSSAWRIESEAILAARIVWEGKQEIIGCTGHGNKEQPLGLSQVLGDSTARQTRFFEAGNDDRVLRQSFRLEDCKKEHGARIVRLRGGLWKERVTDQADRIASGILTCICQGMKLLNYRSFQNVQCASNDWSDLNRISWTTRCVVCPPYQLFQFSCPLTVGAGSETVGFPEISGLARTRMAADGSSSFTEASTPSENTRSRDSRSTSAFHASHRCY